MRGDSISGLEKIGDYLEQLYEALEKYDAYLWKTRDSDGDGLLELWCIYDTAEDYSSRLLTRYAPSHWPYEIPPGRAGRSRAHRFRLLPALLGQSQPRRGSRLRPPPTKCSCRSSRWTSMPTAMPPAMCLP